MLTLILEEVESCNLNFLIGSGLSSPYLQTLGKIESLLSRLEDAAVSNEQETMIKCALYKSYCDGVISKNYEIVRGAPEAEPTLNAYSEFLKLINALLLDRKSTILSKEANLFTTNIDIFLECAVERIGLECNDGFSGRFEPRFAISNFKKTHLKKSLQYDNVSELPTINLVKLHGSLTWRMRGRDKIVFSPDLADVADLRTKSLMLDLEFDEVVSLGKETTFENLVAQCEGKAVNASTEAFLKAYDELVIVNPTKAKFRHSLINQTHYELLRIYANELEKENTLLFVLGFSFADEHIREMTLRAANSNPTLMVYVIAYDSMSAKEIRARFLPLDTRNNNIEIIAPTLDNEGQDAFKYDLATINRKIFGALVERVDSGASSNTPNAPIAGPSGK